MTSQSEERPKIWASSSVSWAVGLGIVSLVSHRLVGTVAIGILAEAIAPILLGLAILSFWIVRRTAQQKGRQWQKIPILERIVLIGIVMFFVSCTTFRGIPSASLMFAEPTNLEFTAGRYAYRDVNGCSGTVLHEAAFMADRACGLWVGPNERALASAGGQLQNRVCISGAASSIGFLPDAMRVTGRSRRRGVFPC